MTLLTEKEAAEKWNRRGRPRGGDYSVRYCLKEKLERLSAPDLNSECRLWVGALNDSGYGRVKVRKKFRRAHIVAWELSNGPVPKGKELDHVCRVRRCINVAHLEPVTKQENLRRGVLARGLKLRRLANACD